jgi:hypothetical protein
MTCTEKNDRIIESDLLKVKKSRQEMAGLMSAMMPLFFNPETAAGSKIWQNSNRSRKIETEST